MIGKRKIGTVLKSALQTRHYKALWNMWQNSKDFSDTLTRYLSGKGSYPFACPIQTPMGVFRPTLNSYYDLLTLNEIFFRGDYGALPHDQVVVDVGSNIGLSALYFLTRNPSLFCYVFEPDPRNIERLTNNLAAFKDRYELSPTAVYNTDGPVEFGVDFNSGRYGGIKVDFGKKISVACQHINTILDRILKKHRCVDILKIDTEGTEIETVKAIHPDHLIKIKKIYLECSPEETLFPSHFRQSQRGTVCCLINVSKYQPVSN